MKYTMVVLSILLTFVSCKQESELENTFSELDFVQIAKGILYSYSEGLFPNQDHVITSKSEWDNLLEALNTPYPCSIEFAETKIDFTRYSIIAVFDEVGNSANSIEIASFQEYVNKIVAIVSINRGIASDIAQPFHIVKIPISKKKIEFKHI